MPALSSLPGIAFRGICTAKGLNAEHTGRKHNFAFATTDVEEVLQIASTDAVFIATRHNLHAELVIAALRAGKHVFVEKPLCLTSDELLEIEACLAERPDNGPVLTVGFNRRFAPGLSVLQNHFRGIVPLSTSYRFSSGSIPAEHWVHDENVGGGRIVGEACHAIDLCAAIAGSVPVKVYAESAAMGPGTPATDDRVFISMRHSNGSISSVSYQAGGDRAFPVERIEVFGGGKVATMDDWGDIELWSDGRRTRARGGHDRGHRAELEAFFRAVREGGPWPIPWEDIRTSTSATLAAVQSLRDGAPLTIT